MANQDQNTIERQLEMKASISKVWRALTDSKQFGQWFQMKCEGPFVVGKTLMAKNTYPGFEFTLKFMVKDMKPETYFAYAWHPFPTDESFDYSKEEPTLVEFFLEETKKGTLVKVKESGFNKITASRRAKAYQMHEGGWEEQLRNIEKFLA